MTNNKYKGRFGEEIAERYLNKKGYVTLARNYRFGRNEVDLVMKDGNTIVFVEVKSRMIGGYGSGYEAVDEKKRMSIIRCAVGYCSNEIGDMSSEMRFDVIEVDTEGKNINHYENAFYDEHGVY